MLRILNWKIGLELWGGGNNDKFPFNYYKQQVNNSYIKN